MGWIADEILAEITAGKQVEREVPKGPRSTEREVATVEYTGREQLALALRILLEYAEVAHATWQSVSEYAGQRLGTTVVRLFDVDANEFVQPFSTGFQSALEGIRAIVDKLVEECGIEITLNPRLARRPVTGTLLRDRHER
jgi:hypothetical protein